MLDPFVLPDIFPLIIAALDENIDSICALAQVSREFLRLTTEWAVASRLFSDSYGDRGGRPATFPGRLFSAFTCYCGRRDREVRHQCSCWGACDNCFRALPRALLIKKCITFATSLEHNFLFGVLGMGLNGVPGMQMNALEVCRFGCCINCQLCGRAILAMDPRMFSCDLHDNVYDIIVSCMDCAVIDNDTHQPGMTNLSIVIVDDHAHLFPNYKIKTKEEYDALLTTISPEEIRKYDPASPVVAPLAARRAKMAPISPVSRN